MHHGLVDIHSHVLPGVDDGAGDVTVSDEMYQRYREAGFETVLATPHLSMRPDQVYVKKLSVGFLEAYERAQLAGIKLVNGSEIRLSPEIQHPTINLDDAGLGGTKYILVDFPSGNWPYYAEDSLFQLQTKGYDPILAHPERYNWGSNHRSIPQSLVDRGVLFQVTLGSFTGMFGTNAKRVSRELLEKGLVHFTASDAHSSGSRFRSAMKGMEWLANEYGDTALLTTLKHNPLAMLNEGEIDTYLPGRRRRQWIGFDFKRFIQRPG